MDASAVTVRLPNGQSIVVPFETGLDSTVRSLMESIARRRSIPVESQRLVVGGRELQATTSLRSIHLAKETIIHLVARPTSTGTATATATATTGDGYDTSTVAEAGRRARFTRLEEVHHPPPSFPANFITEKIFVWCTECRHKPLEYGDGVSYPQELQHGVVRPLCGRCGSESVELESAQPPSWSSVFQQTLQGRCHNCTKQQSSSRSRLRSPELVVCPIRIEFRCHGERLEPLQVRSDAGAEAVMLTMCRSMANTVPLPNLVYNERQESLDSRQPDAVQLMFHPCGHRYSLQSFVHAINARVGRSTASKLREPLRSLLLRNTQLPELFGQYVPRCLTDGCQGLCYLPACKVLPDETRMVLKEWSTVEYVLSTGGVMCGLCQTAFFPEADGARQRCQVCEIDVCIEHQMAWAECPHAVEAGQQSFIDTMERLIEETIEQGATCSPPCGCAPVRDKQDDSTRIQHPEHQVWCYMCERPLNLGHNRDYLTNATRCPPQLHLHPQCKGSAIEALVKFHRLRTVRLLNQLRSREGYAAAFDRAFARVPRTIGAPWAEHIPAMAGISLMDVMQYDMLPPVPHRMP